MKVACCQTNIAWEDKKANFDNAEKFAADAVKRGATVVCFPELFSTGGSEENARKLSESIGGETCSFLSRLAKEHKTWVIGSMIENVDGKARNSCLVFDRAGELVSRYHKIHPFTFGGEQKYFEPGDALAFFEIDGVKCATFICYDLRFPEIFRIAALNGAEACFVPAAWPYPRQEHWRTLLRARAIENQMFVIGVNRVGDSPKNKYPGFSAVIDPLGNVLAEGKEGDEDLVVADIDVSSARDWRKKFPCLRDARYDLYKKLSSAYLRTK